jgi:urea transporter
VSATWRKYDPREIEDGIHGCNPTLVGMATFFDLDPKQFLPWLFLIVGAVLSVKPTKFLRTYVNFPTYTIPFIVVTWAVQLLANGLEGKVIDRKPEPPRSKSVPTTFRNQLARKRTNTRDLNHSV